MEAYGGAMEASIAPDTATSYGGSLQPGVVRGSLPMEAHRGATEAPIPPDTGTSSRCRLTVRQRTQISADGSLQRHNGSSHRAGDRDRVSMHEDLRRRKLTGCQIPLHSGKTKKRRGACRSTPPREGYTVSGFERWGAGDLATGSDGVTGGGVGCGISGIGFALLRPRNGCTPNSASFSERMP